MPRGGPRGEKRTAQVTPQANNTIPLLARGRLPAFLPSAHASLCLTLPPPPDTVFIGGPVWGSFTSRSLALRARPPGRWGFGHAQPGHLASPSCRPSFVHACRIARRDRGHHDPDLDPDPRAVAGA